MTDYKKDFPLLAGSDIAYLDNAATAQRPEAVLKAVEDFYTKKNANPLRGLYELGIEATEAYEAARERVREFINAGKTSEVVFTRNSTESLNLIAYSYGLTNLKAGDEILISIDNHHSNILPAHGLRSFPWPSGRACWNSHREDSATAFTVAISAHIRVALSCTSAQVQLEYVHVDCRRNLVNLIGPASATALKRAALPSRYR